MALSGNPNAPGRKAKESQNVYEKDVDQLIQRMLDGSTPELRAQLPSLAQRLKDLRERNMLKINHSILELVVAKYLIQDGYEVSLEHTLESGLTCDVFASKGLGTFIVEVETGYVPPSHALDPVDYIKARIASKIARYSGYCNKFSLGSPAHYVMPIPRMLTKPPRTREQPEIDMVKRYCDMYYSNPPVSNEEIVNAHIHSVQVIDVENLTILEVEPREYIDRSEQWYR
ncbi:MAG: hypothetical protein LUQ39_03860 [Methanomassiliicoccales archaeon]|jgi:hypothetical protein|nr:hypothetical protein [Methanomassiliicoccales archaeon]